MDLTAQVDVFRCAGCGVCVLACPQEALSLFRRPEAEVLAPPATELIGVHARGGRAGSNWTGCSEPGRFNQVI